MNKVILMGRLTRDPDIRSTAGDRPMTIARYTLAVDRRVRRDAAASGQQQTADFISCVAFDRNAEFAEKYLRKGTKIAVTGRIQTGSYQNKDGQTVYTTDVVIEDQEFAESKNAAAAGGSVPESPRPQITGNSSSGAADGFMNIPDGIGEDELPFGG